jgi:hypothetical protein
VTKKVVGVFVGFSCSASALGMIAISMAALNAVDSSQ